jgi:ABC-type lipoprotein release transport system permease subunit
MLTLAWRNLWRNRTRTVISISAIAFSFGLYLVSIGIGDASYTKMEQAAAKASGGTILIHGDTYWERQRNDIVVESGRKVSAALRDIDGVDEVFERILFDGLVSTSAGSTALRLQGVDPSTEAKLQDMRGFVIAGSFLDDGGEKSIVLGAKIVDELELSLGDRVVVTATGPDGEMRRALFFLNGIIKTGNSMVDGALGYATIPALDKAFDLKGGLTQIGILTQNSRRNEVRSSISEKLNDDRLEILTWDEARPEIVGMIAMDKSFGDIYSLIVFIVVIFAIMNTFLMIVMERVREFGLVSAIGLKPRKIATLLLMETLVLALVAVAFGIAIGFAGHSYLAIEGLDLKVFYGEDIEIAGVPLTDTLIKSVIDPLRWAKATIGVFFMVLLAAIYPAYKAAKLQPAEAMRFYE